METKERLPEIEYKTELQHQVYEITQKQALPLEAKIMMSKRRIREWYEYHDGRVYVAFSGGKDSTVLLHLVRSVYPRIKGVFCNTGLEFPEIQSFVKSTENVRMMKPRYSFKDVIDHHGYPVVSKKISHLIEYARGDRSPEIMRKLFDTSNRFSIPQKWRYLIKAPFKISSKCCDRLKKEPAHIYTKKTGLHPYVGMMAADSKQRMFTILKYGCNAYETKHPSSNPLSFWLEKDIWEYLREFKVPYSEIYNLGYKRTGCVFCMFGVHMEKGGENRFTRLKKTHPKMYDYCINQLGLGDILDYLDVSY